MKTELTKAEEQIMKSLWTKEPAMIKDVLEKLPEPKPAYNTVATFLKILENKGFVKSRKHGSVLLYESLIARDTYKQQSLGNLVSGYFGGSYKSMLSFFVKEKNMKLNEIQELLDELKNEAK